MRTAALRLILILAFLPFRAVAFTPADQKAAEAICAQAYRDMRTLVESVDLGCTPAGDGQNLTLIFATPAPIFATPQMKKPYLIALVGVVGNRLNQAPNARITRVAFMDKHLGERREYFTISVKEVMRLQREIKADRLTLDMMYDGILAAGRIAPVGR